MRHASIRGKNMSSHREEPIQKPKGRAYLYDQRLARLLVSQEEWMWVEKEIPSEV